MAIPCKPFYFLRHGETEWNRRHICTGSQDIPLNHTGENQAREAGYFLEEEGIKHIFTSPLLRCVKTAEIIKESLTIDVTVIDELTECSWGEYEGKSLGDVRMINKWLDGSDCPGVEHINDFTSRILYGFNMALNFQEPVLIISHGGVYHALQKILGWSSINLKTLLSSFSSTSSSERSTMVHLCFKR